MKPAVAHEIQRYVRQFAALCNFCKKTAAESQNCAFEAMCNELFDLGSVSSVVEDKLTTLEQAWEYLEANRLAHVLFSTPKAEACRLNSAC